MERNDVTRELADELKAAYAAGKAAERPFDSRRPEHPPQPPTEKDGWHH